MMKVAVSANGREIDTPVDPRFGRCQQFLIVDTDTMQYEVLDNPNITASGGAGIQTAQFLASQNIQAVITGNCGPNAFMTLEAVDIIEVFVGASGSIQDAVEQYKNGQLQAASQANVAGHFGDQRGMGPGQGRGMGRGRR